MGAGMAESESFRVQQQPPQEIETLRSPTVEVIGDVVCKTYAVKHDSEQNVACPVGVVTIAPGYIRWVHPFEGTPTGKYSPANFIKGFVGKGEVYAKNVRKDLPLTGLRTVLAQRRAAKAIRRLLK